MSVSPRPPTDASIAGLATVSQAALGGSEVPRVDAFFAANGLSEEVRQPIWESARRILERGPTITGEPRATGIAVGYVQSGKTTSFTALTALGVESGYRVVVALLGSTNLLLEQNRARILDALALSDRHDYRWIHLENPSPSTVSPDEISHYVSRGRLLLVTLLKHHGRIRDCARILNRESIGTSPVLVVDDEADQVSLNTRVNSGDESATYAAIRGLRSGLGPHLYVQYTATPYAPLLLQIGDLLSPDFVELLQPGPGYMGGRELLVDAKETVVRPANDAPGPREEPIHLPHSLRVALAEFFVGAALLIARDLANAPISMLVHPSGLRDPQRRYEFLIRECLERWRSVGPGQDQRVDFQELRRAAVAGGAEDVSDAEFHGSLAFAMNEVAIWRVNSDEDANRRVDWNLSPTHVIVGGNKLDRGFTVEGLTVSWIGRPPSSQVDTTVQRARAYGYRSGYLPYCRIYGSERTIEVLTAGVETELDMRARLRDWVDEGLPVQEWASQIGLVMRPGLRPTRNDVIRSLVEFHPGWHFMSRPSLDPEDTKANRALIEALGLFAAPLSRFGRVSHRVVLASADHVADAVGQWAGGFSPGWDAQGVRMWLMRLSRRGEPIPMILLTGEAGQPRLRNWDPRLGFEQLMQGADAETSPRSYPGDRYLMPGTPQMQVHFVRPTSISTPALALAARVPGGNVIARRGDVS